MRETWVVHEDVEFDSDKINQDLAVGPWAGHRGFAYDLILFARPSVVVELGTHYGCSFFSFLQAIRDGGLDTKLFGVDSWEGDQHAGEYGEDVYKLVKQTVSEKFPSENAILIREYFDKAVDQFEDESIDILHIDGLHTFEAVKHDFLTYLPKLKKDGVVLFHDIADYTGYGSHEYWLNLKSKYKNNFEFSHSWGLGVLFPKGDSLYNDLIDQNMADKLLIYKYMAEYKLCKIKLNDHMKMLNECMEASRHQDYLVDERDKYIEELENRLNGS